MAVRETLATNVRAARDRAGLSQAALAERCGVSTETISRVERGRFEPAMTTVVAIASALGVSIDGLVGSGQPDQRPQAPKSPLAGRLVTVASMLDDSTQAALLAFVEQLAKRDRRRRAAKSQL